MQLARHLDRPHTLDYIGFVFDDFTSCTATGCSRRTRRSSAAWRAWASCRVVLIGHQKGHTTSEMMERNFGMPQPEGYRKALRLMRYAEQASACRS